ncbi:MAG: hypothetical protein JL50_04655 [Peptococcaceae bacterium BICA1-7]|nr:MAG: hypothetical protein JL50_04655 [Peptococcaceae bacterium BICA1-7]HBV95913.1 hypothetical protein [Desulfotomaculum sp.]
MTFDPGEWIFKIMAIYASIISTATLYYIMSKGRISVRVTAQHGEEAGLNKNILVITAVNNGKKPLTVTVFGIITPAGERIIVPSREGALSRPELPTRLKEGQACTGYFDLEKNFSYLYQYGKTVILQGFFIDAEKRDYLSEPIKVVLPTLPDNVKVLVRPGELRYDR